MWGPQTSPPLKETCCEVQFGHCGDDVQLLVMYGVTLRGQLSFGDGGVLKTTCFPHLGLTRNPLPSGGPDGTRSKSLDSTSGGIVGVCLCASELEITRTATMRVM